MSPNKSVRNSLAVTQSRLLDQNASMIVKSPKRLNSPSKTQYIQSYIEDNQVSLSPEVNKAIAKELYIDSVINVVSPKKGDKSGVIPGQMNLFNPIG